MDGGPEDPHQSTRSHGAWLRAALELESWADPLLVGEPAAEAMRKRIAELRGYASHALGRDGDDGSS
jgi:hypothetical protein